MSFQIIYNSPIFPLPLPNFCDHGFIFTLFNCSRVNSIPYNFNILNLLTLQNVKFLLLNDIAVPVENSHYQGQILQIQHTHSPTGESFFTTKSSAAKQQLLLVL